MYILATNGRQIVNAEFVERFCLSEKDDATLIVASYSDSRPPVTLGRYKDAKEAKDVLYSLVMALAGEQRVYDMPDSTLFFEEMVRRDARVKRRGGS